MAYLIILVVVVIIALWIVKIYNEIVRKGEKVRNSKAQIATQVESRWDALKSLIDATKQYSSHEADVLSDITSSRSRLDQNSSVADFEKDGGAFSGAMGRLMAVVENYPDLKASGIYQKTMGAIEKYEDQVRNSRMVYNDTVTMYNRYIQVVPNVLVASLFGKSPEEYFKNTETKIEMPSWN